MVKYLHKQITSGIWITSCFHRHQVLYSILGQNVYFYGYSPPFFFKVVLAFLHRTTKILIHCVSLKKLFSRVLAKGATESFSVDRILQEFPVTFFKLIFFTCSDMRPLLVFRVSLCQWLTHMLRTAGAAVLWPELTLFQPFFTCILATLASLKRWLFSFTFHAVKYDAVPVCYTLNDLQRSL